MGKRIAFRVEMALPPCATPAMVMEYVTTALQAECGHRMPEDPMSNVDRKSIKCTHMVAPSKD